MKPAAFEYFRASNAVQAVGLLQQYREAKILAGGQSLVPLMNFRLSRPSALVDISGITELARIVPTAHGLRLGALVRHQDLVDNPMVRETIPVLAEAAAHIGHWAVRNRGTVGGSLAHADPAAELPAVMVALGADIVVMDAEGERKIPARAFFVGFYTTTLGSDALIVAIEMPRPREPVGFYEVVRRHGDFALAGALVEAGESTGAVTWFGVTPAPVRMAWTALAEDEGLRRQQWERLTRDLDFAGDEAFRRPLAVTVAERAYQRARGGH
ncbi:MAG: FAD binding domain-containing protein [Thermaerobacter sp.]|nr:FAD binding domain-containing protein [Thermaerobacter sp.]